MINTELFKNSMVRIHRKLSDQKQAFQQAKVSGDGVSENENMDTLLTKSKDTTFRLLVMGRFSSGKSSFINVLLGEKILPEKALPSTALITEIYYGEQKKVVMYPRPGKWAGGNEPFEIEATQEEIKKYSTINNRSGLNRKEANRIDSSFEKMVVYWPLPMLKDGVVLIDSPGTDDPYSNDHIVESYVPKADAILYCIAGTQPYCSIDKNALDRINAIGFKSPVIVTTYFDVVSDGMDSDDKLDYIDTTFSNYYANHTSRECCHYVNSRLGLTAKLSNDKVGFVESGYNELEQFLGKYLTEYRGREKISAVTSMIKLFNKNKAKAISGMIAALSTPISDFDQRIAQANANLEQARKRGELLKTSFRVNITNEKTAYSGLATELYDYLYENLSLDDFSPDTSFSIWHPKDSSKQIAEECSKEIEIRNKKNVADWNNTKLIPAFQDSFKRMTTNMQSDFDMFSEDITRANISLTLDTQYADTEITTGTRVAMFAFALLTGNFIEALLGGVFGFAAFGRTLACEFIAALVLGIVSLFTPIGFPALIVASIAALLGGVGWTAAKAANTIKNKSIDCFRKNMTEQKETIIQNVLDQCMQIFDKAERTLSTAIQDDIAEVQKNIDTIIEERRQNEKIAAERTVELNHVLSVIDGTNAEMDAVWAEFK